MTRIIGGSAGGRRIVDAVRTAHPPDDRPGARGAVLQHRVVVRVAAGAPLPRPVRRLGRGRARGVVARRRRGHPGRVRPPHRPADRRERPRARLRARPTSCAPTVSQRAGHAARGAVRRGVPRPAVPPRRRTVGGDLALLVDQRLAGARARWSWSSARSRSPEPAWPAGIEARAEQAVRRDHALVRSRRCEPDRRPDAPSRLPRVLRPGHQRAPRHRPARLDPLRRGDRRGRREQVEEPAVQRRGAARDARAGDRRAAERDGGRVHRAAHDLLPRARAPTRSSRGCVRSATSTTSCRWRR